MGATLFVQQLINGVSLGSLYALIAVGYTMVYGILRLINFAHGDLLMVSAYAAIYGILLFSLPWFFSFPLAIIATGAVGILLDRAAYKPLRQAPRISLLISAIGASFLMENLALVIVGGVPKPFPRPDLFSHVIQAGDLHIQVLTIYSPLMTLVLVLGCSTSSSRPRQARPCEQLHRISRPPGLWGSTSTGLLPLRFCSDQHSPVPGGSCGR